jgi:Transglycosylase SLT domain
MNGKQIVLFGLGAAAIYYIVTNQNDVETAMQAAGSDLTAAIIGWKSAGSGPQWVPVLNQAEVTYGLPPDMLAAVAYQECSFIENVIRGLTPSSDGLSLGIMQLQTQYYPALVGPGVPVPYTDQNVSDQISQAGQVFASNYAALQSWPATIAAWNQGLTGVENNGITSVAYVQKILANAPAANV